MQMREMTATLGGEEITLAATFKASVLVAEKVVDPLLIARELGLASIMGRQGIPYSPKWSFTAANLPQVLHIGMEAAGDKRKLADVQEMVFAAGFFSAQEIAADYLALLVSPRSEEIDTKEGDAPSGE